MDQAGRCNVWREGWAVPLRGLFCLLNPLCLCLPLLPQEALYSLAVAHFWPLDSGNPKKGPSLGTGPKEQMSSWQPSWVSALTVGHKIPMSACKLRRDPFGTLESMFQPKQDRSILYQFRSRKVCLSMRPGLEDPSQCRAPVSASNLGTSIAGEEGEHCFLEHTLGWAC